MANSLPPQIDKVSSGPDYRTAELINGAASLLIRKRDATLSLPPEFSKVHCHLWDLKYRYIEKKGWVLVVVKRDKAGHSFEKDFGFYPRVTSELAPRGWDGDFLTWFNRTKKLLAAVQARTPALT